MAVHLVRSTKTPARPTLRDQAANTDFDHDAPAMQHPVHVRRAVRTALALQQLALVRLAVQARSTPPPVNPTYCQNRDIDLPTTTDLSYLQRSSGCIHPLDRHQLPATIVQLHSTTRLTSATCHDRPAAFNDSTDLSYSQRSSSCIQRLDRPQLSVTIVQRRTSTTRPYQLPTSSF